MGDNGRFLVNLIWLFEIPWPRTLLYLVLSGRLGPGASLKVIMSCVSDKLANSSYSHQLISVILLTSRRVTHQACLLTVLTLTSMNLKRKTYWKKVLKKNYFSGTQVISLFHYCPLATYISVLASSESRNLICSFLHNCLVS